MAANKIDHFLKQLRMNQYCYKVEYDRHHKVQFIEVFYYEEDKDDAYYMVECLLDELDDQYENKRLNVKLTTFESIDRKRTLGPEMKRPPRYVKEPHFEPPRFKCYDIVEMFKKLKNDEQKKPKILN